MQKVLTAEEMREVDRLTTEKYGIPSLLLMENAAHAAARVIAEKLGGSVAGKSFLILCGKGNNGGDGAALARILWCKGAFVWLYLFGELEQSKGDAQTNLEIVEKISWKSGSGAFYFSQVKNSEDFEDWFATANWDYNDVIIDALFGTGLNKQLNDYFETLAGALFNWKENHKNPIYFSLDVPSGLNANLNNNIGENIQADLTITFTAPKPANVLPPASRFNGELITVNIGSPQELIDNSPSQLFLAEKSDAQMWLKQTKFAPDSHKTARGRALIIAGSRNMAGAAVLVANSAMKTGAGLVRLAVPESIQTPVAVRTVAEALVAGLPETKGGAVSYEALEKVFELTEKTDVVAVGSGLSSDEDSTKRFVRELVERRKFPVLLDADGLNALAPFDLQGGDEFPLVLTPHIGEMRKLMGVDDKHDFGDRVTIVREFAQKHRVILVLKGERNLIAAPDGRVVVSPTGNPGIGKAGSGDTLAGIITGFLAQAVAMKIDVFETVVAALYAAGLAGDIAARKLGLRTMTASDVRDCLEDAFRELENE